MVPPAGARTNRIPTLTWDSVVDEPAVVARDVDEPVAPPPATTEPATPLSFEPLSLEQLNLEPLSLEPPAAPAEEPVAAPAQAPVVSPAEIRTTPPAVIVPAIGDVTSGPESVVVAPTPAVVDPLPEIREATPITESIAPLLPSIPAPAPRPQTVASPFEFDPASIAPAPTRQPRRRKKRSGLKLVVTIIALGGVVAGGFVFGQTYLVPSDWDGAVEPYARAVESVRGVEFAEPLSIIGEPTAEFVTRLQTQLASASPEELAQWRALGLSSGVVDEASLATPVADWQDAIYSTADGQVYHDLGVAGAELDAQLVQAMAAASLDQEFGWSVEQPARSLDAAAATSAEVLRQVRSVQQSSEFVAPVPAVAADSIGSLPAPLGYRLLAPHVFAEFDASIEPAERTNPLSDLGVSGPGILGSETTPVATGPTMLDGDVMVTTPAAKDRSFWYLVFAGSLDARTAFDASEAIVENALTAATRGSTDCVYATFSGSGVEQTDTLRSALTDWAAAAPPESASSFLTLGDGTLQLVSCDPGAGFVSSARPELARELVAWRMAELATMEAVRVGGGGAEEFVDAWEFVQAAPVALDLMSLPTTTTPAEMATAAKQAVNALFTPAG